MLRRGFVTGDFDTTAKGGEIIFDRAQEDFRIVTQLIGVAEVTNELKPSSLTDLGLCPRYRFQNVGISADIVDGSRALLANRDARVSLNQAESGD